MTCFTEKGLKLERFGRSRSGSHPHSLALAVSHSLVATETLVPACHPLARHPMKRIVHDDGEIISWDQVCSIDFQTFATK